MKGFPAGTKVRILVENADRLPIGAEGTVTEMAEAPSGKLYAMTEFPDHKDMFGTLYAVRAENLEVIPE